MGIFYFDFADNELVHEMDLDSNKRKKVSDSSIRKSKKVNMRAETFLKNLNIGRQRNLVLESRIAFHATKRLLNTINGHTQSGDHNKDCWIVDSRANAHACNDPKWLTERKLRLNPLEMSISSSIKEALSSGELLVQKSSI